MEVVDCVAGGNCVELSFLVGWFGGGREVTGVIFEVSDVSGMHRDGRVISEYYE